MLYQLRNRIPVANTELTLLSAALSVTLKHNKDKADKLSLNKGLGTNRLKRGLSGLTKKGTDEF
jgi:hypothetical protein